MKVGQNWILITGQPVDTTVGGGFEFFGPFTEEEAETVRQEILGTTGLGREPGSHVVIAVQLLHWPLPRKEK